MDTERIEEVEYDVINENGYQVTTIKNLILVNNISMIIKRRMNNERIN